MNADLAVQILYATMAAIGFPLAMVAGWRDKPKKKAGAQKRPGRRPSAKKVKGQKKTKTDKKKRPAKIRPYQAPPLSEEQQAILTNYHVKKDFPNYQP